MSSIRNNSCVWCKNINLGHIFDLNTETNLRKDETFKMDLKATIQQLQASPCALCQLFASMASPNFGHGTCHLRTFTMAKCFLIPILHTQTASTLLSVSCLRFAGPRSNSYLESGYISSISCNPQSQLYQARRILPESFNIEFATSCLDYCQNNHSEACKGQRSEIMPFFRLIDCKSREVVTAPPTCEYMALSYVWGKATIENTVDANNPENWSDLRGCPKVVSDSIEVTLKMDMQYLWIDRYCINQLDKIDKQNQIRQMDLIYSNAKATIIAAAGDGPNHGLPGVNGTLRNPQPMLEVDGHTLVSTLPHCSFLVNSSKWVTRGWTYQEGILSKRRLIFTDNQILYECNEMHCAEALNLDLDSVHTDDKKFFLAGMPTGAFGDRMVKSVGSDPEAFIRHVAEFSKRSLTFPGDVLNAMEGIFHAYETSHVPVYQIFGIPISPALYMKPEEAILIGLSWAHSGPAERNYHFPSWSWAGWIGEVRKHLLLDANLPGYWSYTAPKISIELENGELRTFPGFDEVQAFFSDIRPSLKYIRIDSWTISGRIVYWRANKVNQGAGPGNDGYYLVIRLDNNVLLYTAVKLDLGIEDIDSELRSPGGKKVLCLHFDWDEKQRHQYKRGRAFTLIVEELDGYAERLGCCFFSHFITTVEPNWTETDTDYSTNTAQAYSNIAEDYSNYAQAYKNLMAKAERRMVRLG